MTLDRTQRRLFLFLRTSKVAEAIDRRGTEGPPSFGREQRPEARMVLIEAR